jgi:uncharacterized protein YebE (UPF0316 family)
MNNLLLTFDVTGFIVIPLLIFIARIADVTLGTIRVICISRGHKYLAPLTGFFEVLIWIIVIGQVMKNLTNPVCYLAYASGYATGNYVGILLIEKMSLGTVAIRVITQKDPSDLVQRLKDQDYGVTRLEGHGTRNNVNVVFTIAKRKNLKQITDLIQQFNPNAFFSVEEVDYVQSGIFPSEKNWIDTKLFRMFRPFRKGK